MTADVTTWTIYDHPSGFPRNYVACEWLIVAAGPVPTGTIVLTSTLEMLREVMLVNFGKTRVARDEGDDPVIVETWV